MGIVWAIASAAWGFLEATLFFIVPDVVVTAAVVRYGPRSGIGLAVVAALFACGGGMAMWYWGAHDASAARRVLLMIPAIGPDLLLRAHREMAHDWPAHMLIGAVSGVPYKIYAVEAGARGISPILFVPASFAARLTRILIAVGLTAVMRATLSALNRKRWIWPAWAAGWLGLYVTYFALRALA